MMLLTPASVLLYIKYNRLLLKQTVFMKKILFIILVISGIQSKAQTIGIGTNRPDSNAILDIYSNNKGILMPRTSTESRLKIPPVKGLLVYDTTTNAFWFNNGAYWL